MTASNISVGRLIQAAFDIRDYQILNLPRWTEEPHYDVLAKSEAGAELNEKQTIPMIQRLLEDRFQLKYHRETRDLGGYSLMVATGGPKLKDSESEKSSTSTTSFSSGKITIEALKISMPRLALVLDGILKQPVVDGSGLSGTYDIKLEYDASLNADPTLPSLFTALHQLGLRLQTKKVPVAVIVIENVSPPSDN